MMGLLLMWACTGSVNCKALSADECAKQSSCVVVTGQKAVEAGDCYTLERSEPVACTDAAMDSCGFFSTFVGPGDGTCYLVSASCTPRKWKECGMDTGDICR